MLKATESSPSLDAATVRSIIFGVLLAMFLASLEQTIIATALPTIGRELGNVEDLSWVVTSYLLSSTAVTPLYGKLSDIHGRRVVMLIAIGVFIVGSIFCALAPTMAVLVTARAVQGLGGGGLMALAMTIIADLVPPRDRGRYQVYFAAVFISSSIVGPVLGGFFAEHLHWSVIFWINLPIGAFILWFIAGRLRLLPRHERPHRLDILGAALLVAATVPLLLAMTWGGTRYDWGSLPVIALLICAVAMALAFVLRMLTATEPFLPLAIVIHPVVGPAVATGFCSMGTFVALSIYMPIYLEVALDLTSSVAGLALIPLMAGTVLGAQVSGRLIPHISRYKPIGYYGLGAAVLALLGMAYGATSMPLALALALLSVAGFGMGTIFPLATLSSQNAVPLHQLGTTTSLLNFFRSLGGAIIVAIFGAIVIGGRPAMPELASGFDNISVTTFHWLFTAAAIGLFLGLCWLFLMEERPMAQGPTHS